MWWARGWLNPHGEGRRTGEWGPSPHFVTLQHFHSFRHTRRSTIRFISCYCRSRLLAACAKRCVAAIMSPSAYLLIVKKKEDEACLFLCMLSSKSIEGGVSAVCISVKVTADFCCAVLFLIRLAYTAPAIFLCFRSPRHRYTHICGRASVNTHQRNISRVFHLFVFFPAHLATAHSNVLYFLLQ